MKKTKYLLTLLAAGTILTAGIGQAMAYFTTYVEAEGNFTIRLGDETKITETFTNWMKTLTVTNEEGSEPVYVRAKAFYAPDSLNLIYTGDGWSPGDDDYYYYNAPIAGGESAAALNVKIENIPTDVAKGDVFNVIVIYESTPVLYHEDGTSYADWNSELVVTGRTESSAKTDSDESLKKPDESKKPDDDNNKESGTEGNENGGEDIMPGETGGFPEEGGNDNLEGGGES